MKPNPATWFESLELINSLGTFRLSPAQEDNRYPRNPSMGMRNPFGEYAYIPNSLWELSYECGYRNPHRTRGDISTGQLIIQI